MSLPPVFILVGRPGAGKGTIAAVLAAAGWAVIGTGQACREYAAGPSPEQRAFAEKLARGEWATDEEATRIVLHALRTVPASAPGLLLDGYPRNVAQLATWRTLGIPATVAVVEASAGTCLRRMGGRGICPADGAPTAGVGRPCPLCGRATIRRGDDASEATLLRRLSDYETRVAPLIEVARGAGMPVLALPCEVDGEGSTRAAARALVSAARG